MSDNETVDIETAIAELNARLISAEGQLWGLTELWKGLIRINAVPADVVKKKISEMRDAMAHPDPSRDQPTSDFVEAARKLMDNILGGSDLSPPPPGFSVIEGGKS